MGLRWDRDFAVPRIFARDIIDAAARRVRYLSVLCSGWFGRRRYLVQADQSGQIEGEGKALRLRVDLRNEVPGLDAAAAARDFLPGGRLSRT